MQDYNFFASTFSQSRKNLVWQEITSILQDIKQQKFTSCLDVGCGNGRFLQASNTENHHWEQYLGIDSAIGMIEEAKKIHPQAHFQVLSMQEISSLSHVYDVIVCIAAFHHLKNHNERLQTLRSFQKILAPDGRIYLTNWNLLDQNRYTSSHRGNGDFDIKIGKFSRYYHGFTEKELEELYTQAQYRIIQHGLFEGKRNFFSILTAA